MWRKKVKKERCDRAQSLVFEVSFSPHLVGGSAVVIWKEWECSCGESGAPDLQKIHSLFSLQSAPSKIQNRVKICE